MHAHYTCACVYTGAEPTVTVSARDIQRSVQMAHAQRLDLGVAGESSTDHGRVPGSSTDHAARTPTLRPGTIPMMALIVWTTPPFFFKRTYNTELPIYSLNRLHLTRGCLVPNYICRFSLYIFFLCWRNWVSKTLWSSSNDSRKQGVFQS